MGFKAMANQYITHLYARIIYASHNNHGNCNDVYLYGDIFKTSPGHLMSSAGLVLPRWDAASTRAEQPHQKYLGRKSDKCVREAVATGRRNQGGCYLTQRVGTLLTSPKKKEKKDTLCAMMPL